MTLGPVLYRSVQLLGPRPAARQEEPAQHTRHTETRSREVASCAGTVLRLGEMRGKMGATGPHKTVCNDAAALCAGNVRQWEQDVVYDGSLFRCMCTSASFFRR